MPKKLRSALLIAVAFSSAAIAQTKSLDIAPQGLGDALNSLASQAGIQLLFKPDEVRNIKAPAVRGALAPEAALNQLLEGTEYTFKETGAGSYVIQKRTAATTRPETALGEVVVTATRTERRIEDVPASVTVITSRDISRQQSVKVEDMLRQVPGLDVNSDPAMGFNSMPMLRGIGGSFAGQTTQTLVDGIATDSIVSAVNGRGGLNFTPSQDIDRIEVVRGPASALYGPSAMGGVINVIPKRWTGAPGAEVYLGAGSHDARSIGAAAGMANEVVDLRLSASGFETDGFKARPDDTTTQAGKDLAGRDWSDKKFSVQASLRPSANQELTFGFQDYRIDAAGFGGHPNYRYKHEGDAATLAYRNEISDQATVKLTYRKSKVLAGTVYDKEQWSDNYGDLALDWYYERDSRSDSLEGQLDWRLSKSNTLTVGASYATGEQTTTSKDAVTGVVGTVDKTKDTVTGLFAQDEHKFSDALTAIVGGRYDRIRLHGDSRNGNPRYPENTDSVFNPRVGLIYAFTPNTSGYASYGTAYVPALNNLKSAGSASPSWRDNPDLKPEHSKTIEFGMNNKLAAGTLRSAIFRTDYTDRIAAMIVATGPTVRQYQNVGKVVAQGFELSFDGKLTGGWEPYANYAYTDSKITSNPNNPALEGKKVQRVAPHKLNFGVAYVPNQTWTAKVGERCVSERYFGDQNTPDQRGGGFCVADAKISAKLPAFGQFGKWEAYLAVNNLFDKEYIDYMLGTNIVEYADRRNAWVGVNGKF